MLFQSCHEIAYTQKMSWDVKKVQLHNARMLGCLQDHFLISNVFRLRVNASPHARKLEEQANTFNSQQKYCWIPARNDKGVAWRESSHNTSLLFFCVYIREQRRMSPHLDKNKPKTAKMARGTLRTYLSSSATQNL